MNYWHMQLHPDNQFWGKEKELLEEKGLIGFGKTDSDVVLNNFNKINEGDIVLIKNGGNVIALVKVVGKMSDIGKNDFNKLDWFQFRRKIEVLEYADNTMLPFPQPRKTLQKALNRYTITYKYIDNWYKRISNPNNNKLGLKLNRIKINDYKILKDFSIDFLDKNNENLPLVVIAGKNGTGKSTLLEFISNIKENSKCEISYQLNGENYSSIDNKDFNENLIYLPAGIANNEEINNIENLILKYIDYFIYEKSLTSTDGYKALQDDIDEIFEGFKLSFQFKNIDFNNKKPVFENYDSIRDDINIKLNDLSTGEKTLLSKILYLYLKEAKDKLILIDEPELSLHPSWQNRVLKIYENFAKINNNQIILATHSPYIIGGAKKEYLKVLVTNQGEIEIIDNFDQSYGLEVSKVLTDIMGVEELRTPKIENDLLKLKRMIIKNEFQTEKFKKLLNDLKVSLGKNDMTLKLLQLEINMREKKCLK